MKIIIIITTLLSAVVFANEGQELHDESCIACHIVIHDADFYTHENRKMKSLSKLSGQVSRCAQNFRTGWFPDEEASVVNYLNDQYYHFQKENE